MSTTTRPLPFLMVLSLLVTSCATMQPTADVRDDVYFLPSMAPAMASVDASAPLPEEPPVAQPADDYYDPATSQQVGADRSYYDMTYNDPYFYNYGRFGFGTGLSGWQTGWNGPGWGMSMGYGYGSGMGGYGYGSGNCWGNGYGSNMGWGGGWNNNFYNSWNNPYTTFGSCYNDPYYSGYGGGYGYGNYQGPYGSCYSCYTPVIIGGTSNVVVGHRPSMGSGGGMRTSPGTSRSTLRDPIRLAPSQADIKQGRASPRTGTYQNSGLDRTREQRMNDPYRRTTAQPERNTNGRSTPTRTPERNTIDRGGSDGGRTSPSRDTGGGNSGGGGTRSTPSRR